MSALLAIFNALLGNLGLCARAGALAGGITGGIFGLVLPGYPAYTLTPTDLVRAGLLLGFVAWIAVLVVIGIWLHYGVAAIAAQTLVNSLITSVLTVFLAWAIHVPALATLIGMAVGILVGTILCRFCRRVVPGQGRVAANG